MEIPSPSQPWSGQRNCQSPSRRRTPDHDFPLSPGSGIPACGHGEDRKIARARQQREGFHVGCGDPLAGQNHGVQCSESSQLRRSHVVSSVVFCMWVRESLSIPRWRRRCCEPRLSGVRKETAVLSLEEPGSSACSWQTSTLQSSRMTLNPLLLSWHADPPPARGVGASL